MPKRRLTGKFWPALRARIWEVAEQLHAEGFYKSHMENITHPTRVELREGEYFYREVAGTEGYQEIWDGVMAIFKCEHRDAIKKGLKTQVRSTHKNPWKTFNRISLKVSILIRSRIELSDAG